MSRADTAAIDEVVADVLAAIAKPGCWMRPSVSTKAAIGPCGTRCLRLCRVLPSISIRSEPPCGLSSRNDPCEPSQHKLNAPACSYSSRGVISCNTPRSV